MNTSILNLRKSINKAYLKVKPSRPEFEAFRKNIVKLLDQINEQESEEFHKNILSEFLKETFYSPDHYINTKGRADLVIHNGKDTDSSVGVLIETKKPGNRIEMPAKDNLNTKAFHELLLYYFRERITDNNLDIKYLIATDIYEWYIFNAGEFERLFAGNKNLVKQFRDFEEGRLSGKTTDFFYRNIAESFIGQLDHEISVTHIDIRDYEKILRNGSDKDEKKLVALYKIFSPEHLLKLPFTNDSNTLDKGFYNELLHIIGLKETKAGSKKLIGRKPEDERDAGSLIENAVTILKYEDCLAQVEPSSGIGGNKEEQLYNIALELVITWINRILFLKLLEGQLVRYHDGDEAFKFLNINRISDYDTLNKLFFQVLAVKENERNEPVKQKFGNIPYLNSSLFEPNDLEHKTIRISNLEDEYKLPVPGATVLKDSTGKRLKDEMNTLQYLFEFLDAYDFASEGTEEIQEENKTLINASVLGLIFEKINGYKEGSFFTPGFITMYMCRETIRRAVVQKFNEAKGWNCKSLDDIYDKIDDKKEANRIINSLRICDPAVGSGHFLVSTLNELITIKSELKILLDRNGRTLRDYHVEVANDELVITDEDGVLYEYNPRNRESQRVQEALFHEKQTIIENCLFGVDINPNSVKICRLRLWIELLKNTYYKTPESQGLTQSQALTNQLYELETLPNIDINIKCGNSLISRYPLDADIKKALRNSKWSIDSYRLAVMTYRNAQSKEEKREMENLIEQIKKDFESEIALNDKRVLRLNRLKGELTTLTTQTSIFDKTKAEKARWEKEVKKLSAAMQKLETELEEIRSNKIYKNAFEWRFEFPEVLNDDGDFTGFDVVIGNPPYVFGGNEGILKSEKILFKQSFKSGSGKINLFTLFIEQAFYLLKHKGKFSFIIPNTFLRVTSYHESRKLLIEYQTIHTIYDFGDSVFDDAITTSIVLIAEKQPPDNNKLLIINNNVSNEIKQSYLKETNYVIPTNIDKNKRRLISKINTNSFELGTICKEMIFGVVITKNKEQVVSKNPMKGWKPFLEGKDIGPYYIKPIHSYLCYDPKLLHRPRTKEIFEANEKLLVQRITGGSKPLKVAYDNNCYYNKESINNIILNDDNKYDSKYILGILNSKLINWFYANQFTNESKLTVNLSKEYLSQIPIAKASLLQHEEIIHKVNEILSIKEIDYNADTKQTQTEIDQLVYDLYGLTEEEKKIVEEAVR